LGVADDAPDGPTLHIAWTRFQRRQDSMVPLTGFECVFLQRSTMPGRLATALDYAALVRRTWHVLRARRPAVLWVQLPPVVLLWVALAARRLLVPRMKVVADCHNAMFRPPWSRLPGGVRWLRHCDAVLVHNDAVLHAARAQGVPADRLRVLEDVPPRIRPGQGLEAGALPASLPTTLPRPWILLPGSFSADEPIAEVAQAARQMPTATFIITGRTERAARHGHDLSSLPSNVVTPGYLDRTAFDALMRAADVVLGLTRDEGVQLSVCNEAIGFGKPMVVSDTRVLRSMFSAACELTHGHSPAALQDAIRRALAGRESLSERALQLAQARIDAWQARQYADVVALLELRRTERA
jgi:glycosyltransferase involved in cell wall biosynthesis